MGPCFLFDILNCQAYSLFMPAASNHLPAANLTAAELLDCAIRNEARIEEASIEMKRHWLQADFALARGEEIKFNIESDRGDVLAREVDFRRTALLNIRRRLAA
jgi:hypothetical protein